MYPWLAILPLAWLLWVIVSRRLMDNPWQTVRHGLVWLPGLVYVRFVHHLRVFGEPLNLADPPDGPLLIVANHTAGIDPILVQTRCKRPIRWIMAEDMREPRLGWVWRLYDIIFVDRHDRKAQSLRDAIHHLRGGGVIGIYPEGSLERPPEQLLSFQGGVGWLIKRSGARVIPVVIRGTPHVDPAWASLWRTSRSSLEVGSILEFTNGACEEGPEQIVRTIEQRFLDMTGWNLSGSTPSKS